MYREYMKCSAITLFNKINGREINYWVKVE